MSQNHDNQLEKIKLDHDKYDLYLKKIIESGGAPSLQELQNAAQPYTKSSQAKVDNFSNFFWKQFSQLSKQSETKDDKDDQLERYADSMEAKI